MAAGAQSRPAAFDPAALQSFTFGASELAPDGGVSLSYTLGDELRFTERLTLPVPAPLDPDAIEQAAGLLVLLHWVAGVSYFKAAVPPTVLFEGVAPGPAATRLLEALYSEGLGELAYTNRLPALPRPSFGDARAAAPAPAAGLPSEPRRALVAVGGGKDSAVAIEVLRRSCAETALFSIGDAAPIARTVEAAGLPWLRATRRLDPLLFDLNAAGAINGHVPITAIVTCVALLTAALNGFDTVAMANERSASAPNLSWDGAEINHQFSKSLAVERLLAAAVAETAAPVRQLSVLRPASELAIARAFAGMERYHGAFTSCNAIFRIDPDLRASSWCRDCPKCRFVFLVLAPFSEPAHLQRLFGGDLLADDSQFEGFALLAATGGHKPFECVGEEQESVAAMRMLAEDPRWREHAVVRRLAEEVLPAHQLPEGDPAAVLALSDEHDLPPGLLDDLRAVLRA
jgi:UDP-N-acetyl-alpha-D-muramoyl-L-alanyl-L-glutamate epimerase